MFGICFSKGRIYEYYKIEYIDSDIKVDRIRREEGLIGKILS